MNKRYFRYGLIGNTVIFILPIGSLIGYFTHQYYQLPMEKTKGWLDQELSD